MFVSVYMLYGRTTTTTTTTRSLVLLPTNACPRPIRVRRRTQPPSTARALQSVSATRPVGASSFVLPPNRRVYEPAIINFIRYTSSFTQSVRRFSFFKFYFFSYIFLSHAFFLNAVLLIYFRAPQKGLQYTSTRERTLPCNYTPEPPVARIGKSVPRTSETNRDVTNAMGFLILTSWIFIFIFNIDSTDYGENKRLEPIPYFLRRPCTSAVYYLRIAQLVTSD